MATKVVFRKFKEGDVIALFPEDDMGRGMIGSYMHVGQHSDASVLISQFTKPATEEEYAPLMDELESIGYDDLVVRKKIYRTPR